MTRNILALPNILALLCITTLTSLSAHAGEDSLTWNLGTKWGKPHYSQYTAINLTQQWRYVREHATLIISKSKCPTCKLITKSFVDDYDKQEHIKAILVEINGVPGMLRLGVNPKGVNFRTYIVVSGGYQYTFQLGIDKNTKDKISIRLETDLLDLIDNAPIYQ